MSNNENTIVIISGTTIVLVCTLALIFRLIDSCKGNNHEQYNNQEDISFENHDNNNQEDNINNKRTKKYNNNINNKTSNVEITENEINDEDTDENLPSYSELYLTSIYKT